MIRAVYLADTKVLAFCSANHSSVPAVMGCMSPNRAFTCCASARLKLNRVSDSAGESVSSNCMHLLVANC